MGKGQNGNWARLFGDIRDFQKKSQNSVGSRYVNSKKDIFINEKRH